jgi:diguanylate cyclase
MKDGSARGGFMHWLGFGGRRQPDDGVVRQVGLPHGGERAADARERGRRQVLEDISSFLLTHELPLSAATLAIAHDVVTGANAALVSLIGERIEKGQPVTLDWLEDAAEAQGDGSGEHLHSLVARLETSISQFAVATSAARTATRDYNTALETHVGGLDSINSASEVIVELATLARDMIARTREIERELSRSERETRALQKNLADARREAEIDHLTGLPNRRAFEAVLKKEYVATRESGENLCVAFCDIDNFKRINDLHGHEAGDRILRTVAQSLAEICDDKCHVARHGGEEFVVLLRGKSAQEAWKTLDDAREKLANRKFVNRKTDMPFGRVSFSAGIADAHALSGPREALRAADEAMFKAKSAGRNCVLTADAAASEDGAVIELG